MKKLLLALGVIAALSLIFVGCDQPSNTKAEDETPANEAPAEETPAAETVVATGEKGTYFKWADYSITADNADDYIVRVTYTLDDASKAGWGPGAFNDKDWKNNSLADKLNVNADGVNEIPVKDIIAVDALKEGFLINWWADYATLTKVEIIKK